MPQPKDLYNYLAIVYMLVQSPMPPSLGRAIFFQALNLFPSQIKWQAKLWSLAEWPTIQSYRMSHHSLAEMLSMNQDLKCLTTPIRLLNSGIRIQDRKKLRNYIKCENQVEF